MHDYTSLRGELEKFLVPLGWEVLALRRTAEADPDFARLKADRSIVTKADELAEDRIRTWISARFPDDAIRGEERAQKEGGNHVWIIDPIDGTYNFSHFGNTFGISVGLVENNVPKLGVIWYPAEEVMLSAVQDAGAWINARALEIAPGTPHFLEDLDWSYTASFFKFLRSDYGTIIHPGATPYDIAGAAAIARELHMEISDYDGKRLDFSRDIIPIVISKSPELHIRALKTLRPESIVIPEEKATIAS